MKSWVIKVCSPGLAPFWLGSFEAPSRALAKPAARAFAAEHLPSHFSIVSIAEGHLALTLTGPETPFE